MCGFLKIVLIDKWIFVLDIYMCNLLEYEIMDKIKMEVDLKWLIYWEI